MVLSSSQLQPYLAVSDAARAIELYTRVFGMKERYRLPMGDKIGHAELELGPTRLLLSSEFKDVGAISPDTLGGSPTALLLYVDNVDAVVKAALEEGFTQQGETKNEFHGDRVAQMTDPFGHRWFIHQKIEDVPPETIVERFKAMMAGD